MISPVQTYSHAVSLIRICLASFSVHFLQLDSDSHKKTTHRQAHAKAMDVVEQDFTNLSDGASMEVTMGIQPDHGSENTEDTNTSSAKKKARVIKLVG
ncbi:uncharacterized protein LOC126592641 isoform X2 [Malus sylvestris]|uniref:uncharacterized protein LOC126592641 isoform X2 n=1 Tax=Malus sylvestris TaxID=3752 RepID=UPI0021ABE79B|nr:uncharacterized protein LOC126592641 isoform X2 [Malus sylvestris]